MFALDPFDDGLHLASAIWALVATLLGHRGARMFLTLFGALYLGDGLLGLATGSGYLDFGIFLSGTLDLPFTFKIMANTPHILLGGFALWSGLRLGRG